MAQILRLGEVAQLVAEVTKGGLKMARQRVVHAGLNALFFQGRLQGIAIDLPLQSDNVKVIDVAGAAVVLKRAQGRKFFQGSVVALGKPVTLLVPGF